MFCIAICSLLYIALTTNSKSSNNSFLMANAQQPHQQRIITLGVKSEIAYGNLGENPPAARGRWGSGKAVLPALSDFYNVLKFQARNLAQCC